jgi:hypothetical protein
MPQIKLLAAEGEVAHEVEAEDWERIPRVILWGHRAFVRVPDTEEPVVYQEEKPWFWSPGEPATAELSTAPAQEAGPVIAETPVGGSLAERPPSP